MAENAITKKRQEELQKLDNFIESSEKRLSSIVSNFGWTIENLSENVQNQVICPFNDCHYIPEKSLDKHLQSCQWRAEGYRDHDLPLSIPSLPIGAPSSIKFDEQLQDEVIQRAKEKNPEMLIEQYHCSSTKWTQLYDYLGCTNHRSHCKNVPYTFKGPYVVSFEKRKQKTRRKRILFGSYGRLIPRTSDRLIADFTRDERCAMYDYVIANTVEPDIGEDIADMNKPQSTNFGKTSSYLELLAQERNLKRRRAKYRGVHTNKKSQIEILREVIHQQMEMLTEYVSEKNVCVADRSNDDVSYKESCQDRGNEAESKFRNVNALGSDERLSDRAEISNSTPNREKYGRKSPDQFPQRRESKNRGNGWDRRESRNSHSGKEIRGKMGEYTRDRSRSERRDRHSDDERKSHKSSHKKHRHRSRDHHDGEKRRREQSRDYRDQKSDRKSHSTRYYEHDDRGSRKKRRSRSR